MSHHEWGEEGFDWNGLDDAGRIVQDACRRYGRFGGQVKEKWGCLRFYAHFSGFSLHAIFYPGYVYCQFPKWLWNLDCTLSRTVFKPLHGVTYWWQTKVYNWAYQLALKKYPHLRDEILCDADFPELITGGMEVHNKYWKSV